MDKKAKKRLDVLRKKLEKQNQLLAFAKQQTDEDDDIAVMEKQVRELQEEIEKIKSG